MQFRQPAIWLFELLSIGFAYTGISDWDACGGRLERALDALHRDSTRRNKLDEEKTETLYQRELHSAPLEMSVSRMAVKVKVSSNIKISLFFFYLLDTKKVLFLLIKNFFYLYLILFETYIW